VLNSRQLQHRTYNRANGSANQPAHGQQNHHQIDTIDEFSIARIYRLWENWIDTGSPESPKKLRFYRQVVASAPRLGYIRLATVYVLLARLDATRRGFAQEDTTPLSGTEAGPA